MFKPKLKFAAVLAAALIFTSSVAVAAWHLLSPGEVAEHMHSAALSAAFTGENAVNINQSQTAGGYVFTLMSIVSGDFIDELDELAGSGMLRDRTYAVIAVQREDGSPMEFGEHFSAQPFIRGILPWVFSPSGGGGTTVIDGVMYIIIEFDDVTLFADRGIYIGINSGRRFESDNAFTFDEAGIAPNPDFGGISVLFELPLDPSIADPEKAAQLLEDVLGDWDEAAIPRYFEAAEYFSVTVPTDGDSGSAGASRED